MRIYHAGLMMCSKRVIIPLRSHVLYAQKVCDHTNGLPHHLRGQRHVRDIGPLPCLVKLSSSYTVLQHKSSHLPEKIQTSAFSLGNLIFILKFIGGISGTD